MHNHKTLKTISAATYLTFRHWVNWMHTKSFDFKFYEDQGLLFIV